MTENGSRRDGLARLLGAVFAAETPDPELLVRYARSPDSLESEERAAVEAARAASPQVADQLRVLERFDLDAVLRAAEAELAPPAPARAVMPPTLWERVRDLFRVGPVLVLAGSAATALLAIALLPAGGGEGGEPGGTAPGAEYAWDLPGSRAPAPAEPRPPAPTEETPGPRVVARATRPPGEPLTLASGKEIGTSFLRGEEQQAPTPTTALRYARPVGERARPRVIREARSSLVLTPLAPEHVGRTADPSPTLYWHLVGAPPRSGEFRLRLEEAGARIAERRLDLPAEPGVQATSLRALGIALEPEREYAWSVEYRGDPAAAEADAVGQGWIRRVERAVAVNGSPRERAERLAGASLWYDALEVLEREIAREPRAADAREARRALLESEGLEGLD
jgi:hypothetical protein